MAIINIYIIQIIVPINDDVGNTSHTEESEEEGESECLLTEGG